MLDESLLDTPEGLAEADRRGLLRGAAEAGARVRTAARHAAEAGVGDLKPDGRPRSVLIAGPGAAALRGRRPGGGRPRRAAAPRGRRDGGGRPGPAGLGGRRPVLRVGHVVAPGRGGVERQQGAGGDEAAHGYRGRSAIPWGALPTGIARTCVCVATSMTATWSAYRLVTSAYRPVGSIVTRSG